MFQEKNLSKLIFLIPILFIVLTTSIITFIHIKQSNIKFKNDSSRLKQTFLDDEKRQLNTILDSINSYINFKKSSSINILKDKVKSRMDFSYNVLSKIYNKSVGIESLSAIQLDLLVSLSTLNSKYDGDYFIYGYNNNYLSDLGNPNKKDSLKRDFIGEINKVLETKDEGFIFYKNEIVENGFIKQSSKITYIKKFESLDLVLAYSEDVDVFEEKTKDEVLHRLNLMSLDKNGAIFTLDNSLNFIQNSYFPDLIGKNFNLIEKDKEIVSSLFDYSKMAKIDLLTNGEYKYFWKELSDDSYSLLVFKYIEDWDWLIGINLNINNINNAVVNVIGVNESKTNDLIYNSIYAGLIFILFASFISYFMSKKINNILDEYKINIENQKNALKNINASLSGTVDIKTKQLELLNDELKDKVELEVDKNRRKDQMLFSQSKMAAMGEMIGNIAHQWRQPLSTISTLASGNCVKIDFNLVEQHEIKEDFIKIVESTKHLSETIEDFRNFFMENKAVEKFSLIDLINKNLTLIGSSLQNNYITVIKNFNDVEVTGIKNELLQATINIINNSKDILLPKEEGQRFIVIDIFKDETNAYMIFKDSGGGIHEDIIKKIFEPYFTTKERINGTGIGLYMTKEIIVNHMHGELEVSNEEFVIDEIIYKGACFKISIPLIA